LVSRSRVSKLDSGVPNAVVVGMSMVEEQELTRTKKAGGARFGQTRDGIRDGPKLSDGAVSSYITARRCSLLSFSLCLNCFHSYSPRWSRPCSCLLRAPLQLCVRYIASPRWGNRCERDLASSSPSEGRGQLEAACVASIVFQSFKSNKLSHQVSGEVSRARGMRRVREDSQSARPTDWGKKHHPGSFFPPSPFLVTSLSSLLLSRTHARGSQPPLRVLLPLPRHCRSKRRPAHLPSRRAVRQSSNLDGLRIASGARWNWPKRQVRGVVDVIIRESILLCLSEPMSQLPARI
jgi:hypothetical protein